MDRYITIGTNLDDTLTGGDTNDVLIAGRGADVLEGGLGNDLLIANEGNDTLTGGEGADYFMFNVDNLGHNVITDFEIGVDKLDISFYGITSHTLLNYARISGNDLIFGNPAGDWSIVLEGAAPGGQTTFSAQDVIGLADTIGGSYRGTEDDDILFGSRHSNLIIGGGGDDLISGNEDHGYFLQKVTETGTVYEKRLAGDTLIGGEGDDVFVFHHSDGQDSILDFSEGDIVKVLGYTLEDAIGWGTNTLVFWNEAGGYEGISSTGTALVNGETVTGNGHLWQVEDFLFIT